VEAPFPLLKISSHPPLPAFRDTAGEVSPADARHEPERAAASTLSPATRRVYENDWRSFAAWCAERILQAVLAASATPAA